MSHFQTGFVSTVEVGTRKGTSFRRIREWNLLESVSFPLSLALLFLPSRFHCCIIHSGEGDAAGWTVPEAQPGWEQLCYPGWGAWLEQWGCEGCVR